MLNALPTSFSTPELNVPCAEGEPRRVVDDLLQAADFPGASEIVTIDGLRVDYADGFGLIRASNTTPVLVLRFEGHTAAALKRIETDVDGGAARRQARRSGRRRGALTPPPCASSSSSCRRSAMWCTRCRWCTTSAPPFRMPWSTGSSSRAFAPLLRRVEGIGEVIECALRRWRRRGGPRATRDEWRGFRARLRRERYDAVIDLQGLTKSAVIARLATLADGGARYGLANRTEGASHEPPARWLVDHAIRVEPHIHALDRSRVLAARALGYAVEGPPQFGLHVSTLLPGGAPTLVLVHGSSRDDKLWPEASWIELGRRRDRRGLAHRAAAWRRGRDWRARSASPARSARRREVWPAMGLDALVDRLGATQGVIGVDSGLSHIAVALDLPHVQIYNWPTAWRTGPQVAHGHRHQVSVVARPTPSVEAVWSAWTQVREAAA